MTNPWLTKKSAPVKLLKPISPNIQNSVASFDLSSLARARAASPDIFSMYLRKNSGVHKGKTYVRQVLSYPKEIDTQLNDH